MSRDQFQEIARRCSIEDALGIIACSLIDKRGVCAQRIISGHSYRSPLRPEKKPSWAVYRDAKDSHWRFHDHATGESGNMINLVKLGNGLSSNQEAARVIDERLRLGVLSKQPLASKRKGSYLQNMKLERMTVLHLEQISKSVGVIGIDGARRLFDRGLLGIGTLFRYRGRHSHSVPDCYFLYDRCSKSAMARKRDGTLLEGLKAVAPNGWRKLPIGLGCIHPSAVYGEADLAIICEGEKDLIAVMHGTSYDRAIPIGMPSVTTRIEPEAATRFDGMSCIIYAQADREGVEAALKWYLWLKSHAFFIRILVPKKHGADWADLGIGKNAEQMEALLQKGECFDRLDDEEILQLNPTCYPKASTPPITPKRSGGSPLDVENMKRVWEAWDSLPDDQRESIAALCKALGVNARGKDRAKVERGLSNCFQWQYQKLLRLRFYSL